MRIYSAEELYCPGDRESWSISIRTDLWILLRKVSATARCNRGDLLGSLYIDRYSEQVSGDRPTEHLVPKPLDQWPTDQEFKFEDRLSRHSIRLTPLLREMAELQAIDAGENASQQFHRIVVGYLDQLNWIPDSYPRLMAEQRGKKPHAA